MTIELSNHVLSFSKRLFLSVICLFIAFAACFMTFQYHREKDYKADLLDTQLQAYNDRLHDFLTARDSMVIKADGCDSISNQDNKAMARRPDARTLMDAYVRSHTLPHLRVTLVLPDGRVAYDSWSEKPDTFQNHLDRQEIQQALKHGSGRSVRRQSASLGGDFFYSAKTYQPAGYVIRSALPYDVSLMKHLQADSHYVWFSITVSAVLILIFFRFTRKLGTSISQLQQFAMKADRDEPIEPDIQDAFPHNELGEISQHIIQIYKRLHQTKEDLLIEREKLITHLQISHEGLGVFTESKQEILVNSLFTQYANFISDKNLSSTEAIFSIPELLPVTRFISQSQKQYNIGKEGKRMSLNIDKNGRIFAVECIIFQDNSFEISINDVTQEEEQARLKKQLTQNIAHELKTPVSSIQGYLETIVSNPDLPREKIDTFLSRSYAQSNRLAHLLRDISVLTRMEEAPGMVEMEPVDLSMLMRTVLGEVAQELEANRIKAENLLPTGLTVQGNPSLLYSVFRNLTDNAIAYAGTDITITVRCFRQDERLYYFSFSDTGVGVSPEHLGRLFERFYRVDKGRSRKLGGTGLGLAIVKNAVLLHGGSIFAKLNPGGGLQFIFTLAKEGA